MSDGYKNIKVKPETFERLKDEKPGGVTWSYWLEQLLDDAQA